MIIKHNLLAVGLTATVAAGAVALEAHNYPDTNKKAATEACNIERKQTRAAREIIKNLTEEKPVTYSAGEEAICGKSRIPAPLFHNGKYFSLSLVNEEPVISTLTNPILEKEHRDGAAFISHRGIVDLDTISGIPGVEARLSDGSAFEIAVGHEEPTHRG